MRSLDPCVFAEKWVQTASSGESGDLLVQYVAPFLCIDLLESPAPAASVVIAMQYALVDVLVEQHISADNSAAQYVIPTSPSDAHFVDGGYRIAS